MLIVSGFGRGEVDSDGYSADQTASMSCFQASTAITVGVTSYTRTSSYPYDADTYFLGSSSPLFMLNRSGLGGYSISAQVTGVE